MDVKTIVSIKHAIQKCNTFKNINDVILYVSSLSIRINKDLKEQMGKLDVDWPEYIRKTIKQKIISERRKQAARSMDAIRNKTKHGGFDAAGSIRRDRDT